MKVPKISLEILTEEQSMAEFLKGFLPNILPQDYVIGKNCYIHPHKGKNDLRKSIPRKMRSYSHLPYSVKVIIIHDQDSNDCHQLKQDIVKLIKDTLTQTGHSIPVLVRIACRELENWYLGDLKAVEDACPKSKASQYVNKSKYRSPDGLTGSDEIRRLLQENFSKTKLAREMSQCMSINENDNRSKSFQHFVRGIKKYCNETL